MNLAEKFEQQAFEKVREKILEMVGIAAQNGEFKIAISYEFFNNNNKLLKNILETLLQDGFVLHLYERRMEVRWGEQKEKIKCIYYLDLFLVLLSIF